MQWKFHFEVRIERLKRGGIFLVVNGIEPHPLRQRLRFQNGSVMCGIRRAESRRECADALIAVDLQIENVHDERVAGLCAFDEKRSGERIVAFYKRERVAGFLQSVAETVERIRFQDIAGFQPRDRSRCAVNVFYGVDGGVIADDLRIVGLRVVGGLRPQKIGTGGQNKYSCEYFAAHTKTTPKHFVSRGQDKRRSEGNSQEAQQTT